MGNFDLFSIQPVPKKGILKYLREKFPDQKWSAGRIGFGQWGYHTEDGWTAHWVACLAPRYPDDDDTYESRFYIYKPNDVPELITFV